MSNSNIDNLMLKFAMSRLKAGAVVPPTYQPSPLATPIKTPEQQSLYESAVSTAPRFPGPAGYDQNGFFANTGTVNPDGSFNTTQFNTQGPYSGIDPRSSAFYDMPITGNRGSGVGGMGLAGLLAGLGTYGALKYTGNRAFVPHVGTDPAGLPLGLQQELMLRNLQNGATNASVSRTGGSTLPLPGNSLREMSQPVIPAVPPVKDKKGRIVTPGVPARLAQLPADPVLPRILANGAPAPLTMTQTVPKGRLPGSQPQQVTTALRLPSTRAGLMMPESLGGVPSPRAGSLGSNPATRNAGRVATGVGLATALATGLANQADTDRRAPGMNEGAAGWIPTAPASTQDRTIPAQQ